MHGEESHYKWSLAIHGGAGIIPPSMSKEEREMYINTLKKALEIGRNILSSDGSALDAVEQVVCFMENSGIFNAGKGSVSAEDSKVYMDASIMINTDLKCGSITGVTSVKNPISLARKVMESNKVIFLSGEGAEKFANKFDDIERKPFSYFTGNRFSLGTIGCIAKDAKENFASASSTGGLTGKMVGRIGDSAMIGAGVYATRGIAVSCTGKGEEFIRRCVAHDVVAMWKYGRNDLEKVLYTMTHEKLKKNDGGIIAMNDNGHTLFSYNTQGMFRGDANDYGRNRVFIWEDEEGTEEKKKRSLIDGVYIDLNETVAIGDGYGLKIIKIENQLCGSDAKEGETIVCVWAGYIIVHFELYKESKLVHEFSLWYSPGSTKKYSPGSPSEEGPQTNERYKNFDFYIKDYLLQEGSRETRDLETIKVSTQRTTLLGDEFKTSDGGMRTKKEEMFVISISLKESQSLGNDYYLKWSKIVDCVNPKRRFENIAATTYVTVRSVTATFELFYNEELLGEFDLFWSPDSLTMIAHGVSLFGESRKDEITKEFPTGRGIKWKFSIHKYFEGPEKCPEIIEIQVVKEYEEFNSSNGSIMSLHTKSLMFYAPVNGTITNIDKLSGYIEIHMIEKEDPRIFSPISGTITKIESFEGIWEGNHFISNDKEKVGLVKIHIESYSDLLKRTVESILMFLVQHVKFITNRAEIEFNKNFVVSSGDYLGQICIGKEAHLHLEIRVKFDYKVNVDTELIGGKTIIATEK